MRLIFFLSHPAHFHLFRNTINHLRNDHQVKIVVKSKDILLNLITNEGWLYVNAQKKEKRAIGKLQIIIQSLFGLLVRDINLIKIALNFKPDVMVGTEWALVHVGSLLRIPSIILNEDDTVATPENKCFYPLAKTLLLPTCCDTGLWENKKIIYNGYHELAYLHPNHFEPKINILKKYGIEGSTYFIIRLVKLTASHDTGKKGFNKKLISDLICLLSKYGSVYITSEKELDPEFEQFRLSVNPLDIHHILSYAKIYIGDSQTMAAEAGVLGTPFIRFNDFIGKIGYLNELENKYKLGYGFRTDQQTEMMNKVKALVLTDNLEEIWMKKKKQMLSEKIDVTLFFVWFVENYPASAKIMKENPNYQNRFK